MGVGEGMGARMVRAPTQTSDNRAVKLRDGYKVSDLDRPFRRLRLHHAARFASLVPPPASLSIRDGSGGHTTRTESHET